MKRLFLWMALAAAPVFAQGVPRVQKLITLKYADPLGVRSLINVFALDRVEVNSQMKVIALTGPEPQVTAAETAIKQLDVPSAAQKNIELTVYFIVGSDRESPPLEGNPIPQDLQSVITQLKNAFTFKNYKMLDVLTLRTRSGMEASTTGRLGGGSPPQLTSFSIRAATLQPDGGIRIDKLYAGVRIPYGSPTQKFEYVNTGLNADIDVKEGQKVVVGRSSMAGPEKALFLVLTAQAIQ
jgi:hypothetical protein